MAEISCVFKNVFYYKTTFSQCYNRVEVWNTHEACTTAKIWKSRYNHWRLLLCKTCCGVFSVIFVDFLSQISWNPVIVLCLGSCRYCSKELIFECRSKNGFFVLFFWFFVFIRLGMLVKVELAVVLSQRNPHFIPTHVGSVLGKDHSVVISFHTWCYRKESKTGSWQLSFF